jgi:hypothetical protein
LRVHSPRRLFGTLLLPAAILPFLVVEPHGGFQPGGAFLLGGGLLACGLLLRRMGRTRRGSRVPGADRDYSHMRNGQPRSSRP